MVSDENCRVVITLPKTWVQKIDEFASASGLTRSVVCKMLISGFLHIDFKGKNVEV